MKMFVYVLKLEHGKYYVGTSKSPYKRITEHFNNNGSYWTKKYKPREIIEVIPDCDLYDEANHLESIWTSSVLIMFSGSYTTKN